MSWLFFGMKPVNRRDCLNRMFRPGFRVALSTLFFVVALSAASAQSQAHSPHGDFICRQYTVWSADGTIANVATMHLQADGSYRAKDLTTNILEVHGHFAYDVKKKTINWDSGIWNTLLGRYVPDVAGTSVILVTLKNDPEGKVNGTLQCVQVDSKLLPKK